MARASGTASSGAVITSSCPSARAKPDPDGDLGELVEAGRVARRVGLRFLMEGHVGLRANSLAPKIGPPPPRRNPRIRSARRRETVDVFLGPRERRPRRRR